MRIITRTPVLEVDDTLVVLAIGHPEAEFGDEVTVHAVHDEKEISHVFVAAVDTAPANELALDVLIIFGHATVEALHTALEQEHGTSLPPDIPVTIYTLTDGPVEDMR